MSLIEGIGDEVTQFFIGLIVLLVVSLAWWTTSISEQRNGETAWILDRRRHRTHRRLTNHTHSVTIAEGSDTAREPSAPAAASEVVSASSEPSPPPVTKPPENSPSTSSEEQSAVAAQSPEEEEEQNNIVAAMDADNCVLRQRRLAFYDRNSENASSNVIASESALPSSTDKVSDDEFKAKTESKAETNTGSSDIRIKLKYINDDIRIVEGKLQEQLGDFKKRHFQSELSNNKLVRLIFNGQVLGQDTNTLEGCGFFDNCVVHCLIHQRRTSPSEDLGRQPSESPLSGATAGQNRIGNHNNNNQGRDWDLGNILFAIISFTLLSAWYFRYVYAHLYTVTATVGLCLMTGVFTILIFGFYFPDDVPTRINVSPPPSPAAHQS